MNSAGWKNENFTIWRAKIVENFPPETAIWTEKQQAAKMSG